MKALIRRWRRNALLPEAVLLFSNLFLFSSSGVVRGQTVEWIRQLGTSNRIDESHGITTDGMGNVYFSGFTYGDLGGPSGGGVDGFVAKEV